MRENRLYGSEGGVAERSFLPLCAPVMSTSRRGESPRHRRSSNYVTEGNCINVRRCGEQLDVKDQAVG